MNQTIQINILQMDKDSNLVKKSEYNPEHVPSELKAEKSTEYIIVESIKETFNKEIKVERVMFSKNDATLWYFQKSNNKVLVKIYASILWE